MDESSQQHFIDDLIAAKTVCSVFLINGIRLVGILKRQDSRSIILESRDYTDQLLYKQAISTISPSAPPEH